MNELTIFEQDNPYLVERGIDEPKWNALCSTIYPGANPSSIVMAIDYCAARELDIMMKPVHLVPMNVKNSQTGQSEWRDVVMPGIGLYRIQADRSGNYAGADEPKFGPPVTISGQDAYKKDFSVTYPEWCKYTVYKLVGDVVVKFVAKEYWLENYAVQKNTTPAPNAMWKKRPFAQLAKCAEAQALRKAWPEIGSEPTMDEMEGKSFDVNDHTPEIKVVNPELTEYPQDKFEENFPKWEKAVQAEMITIDDVISKAEAKAPLTQSQKNQIEGINNDNA